MTSIHSISFALSSTPSSRLFISSDNENQSTEEIMELFLTHIASIKESMRSLKISKITLSAKEGGFSSDKVKTFVTAFCTYSKAVKPDLDQERTKAEEIFAKTIASIQINYIVA